MLQHIGGPDFWTKATPGTRTWNDEPCLEWQLHRDKDGYGKVHLDGKMHRAHRVAYEMAVGPIPPKYEIDHLCRNPCCINPRHLEAVTKRVNVLRGLSFCAVNAALTHCKNGHEFTPENTRIHVYPKETRRMCRACDRDRQRQYTLRQRERVPA